MGWSSCRGWHERLTNVTTTQREIKGGEPHLKRVLSLWDLIIYGIVAVTPSAPATVYGVAEVQSHGHAVVTILAGMVAMVLTAISYGRMATLYPSAGSAYTYVGRSMHPYFGFVAGWAMLLCYVVSPLFCVIYGSLALQRAVPELPYWLCAAMFAIGITWLNLLGIRSTARTNEALCAFMFVVLLAYIVLAVRYLLGHQGVGGLFSVRPFYNPATFNIRDIAHATSFAALTYLGFDAVTTLAEDVKNPRRNVMLATVLVIVFTGVFGGLMVYLGQLVWPDYHTYKNIETAFIEVTGRVGGLLMFQAVALLLVIANIGSGIATQVGAARLLFGMGRDDVIPKRFFAHLHPVRNTPNRNIWLIGIVAFLGALAMSYELTAEILNFGAFLGFMGVNFAVIWQFGVLRRDGHTREFLADIVLPVFGFLFCAIIWLGLGTPAKIGGGIWFGIGLFVLAVHTRGFRKQVVLPDPANYE